MPISHLLYVVPFHLREVQKCHNFLWNKIAQTEGGSASDEMGHRIGGPLQPGAVFFAYSVLKNDMPASQKLPLITSAKKEQPLRQCEPKGLLSVLCNMGSGGLNFSRMV